MKLKMPLSLIVCALITVMTAHHAFAQAHIGDGGDPLMMIFAQARHDSAHMLMQVEANGLPSGVEPAVRAFLVAQDPSGVTRMQAMASDIKASPHRWRTGDVGFGRCAVTNKGGDEQAIYLSIDKCREIFSYSNTAAADAAKTLIHEAVHHFGVGGSDDDEALATAVADTVFKLWIAGRRGTAAHWNDIAATNAPESRYFHTAVWTGRYQNSPLDNQILVWGGCNLNNLPDPDACSSYLSTGGRLSVTRNNLSGALATSWREIDESTAPIGRKFHTAIWTGSKPGTDNTPIYRGADNRMVIFGGCSGEGGSCNHSYAVRACADGTQDCTDPNRDHAMFDPVANRWLPVTTSHGPSARIWHTAVWTDKEMLVWGGLSGYERAPVILGDGAGLSFSAQDPQGRWTSMPNLNAPTPRYGHTAVWTGTSMIVWGGCARQSVFGCSRWHNDGAVFVPGEGPNTGWIKAIPGPSFLQGRTGHSMVFTGRHIIIWGGRGSSGVLSDGAIFDLEDQSGQAWRPISSLLPEGESGRYGHTATYDYMQGRMIIWGGEAPHGMTRLPSSTLTYDVTQNDWKTVATGVAPSGRRGHASLWIDDSLLIWGGVGEGSDSLVTGAVLNP